MVAGNLEYLISSLPNLSFSDSEDVKQRVAIMFYKYATDNEASEDLVSILDKEAYKFLSPWDFEFFKTIALDTIFQDKFRTSKNKVVAGFSNFLYQLKNELKTYRLALKSEENIGKSSFDLLDSLSDHPLEAELQLLKLQWSKLEDLNIGHYSNLSALILYKLKLQLLLRWWSFDVAAGYKVFQQTLIEA